MLPKAVIFDLDGTLLDSTWVWDKIDRLFQKELNFSVHPDYYEKIIPMSPTQSAIYTVSEYGLDITPEQLKKMWVELANEYYGNYVSAKSGACEFLDMLISNGVKTALATSCFPELCINALRANNIDSKFDVFCYSDEMGEGKETGKIYLTAANKLQTDACHCAVFEDISSPLNAVKNMGMRYFGIADEKQSSATKKRLESEADGFFENYNDILNQRKFGCYTF